VAHDRALWKELSMPGESEKNAHAWEEIVKQLTREQDRFRVVELAHKLNEAMLAEEREKVRQRLGVGRSNAA
jgi:23S rRNA A2030 N6-methylase RlmJ